MLVKFKNQTLCLFCWHLGQIENKLNPNSKLQDEKAKQTQNFKSQTAFLLVVFGL